MFTPIRPKKWSVYSNNCSVGFNFEEEKDFYEYIENLRDDKMVSREKYMFILTRKLQDEFILIGFRRKLEKKMNEAKLDSWFGKINKN